METTRNSKKILSLLLTLCITISLFAELAFPISAENGLTDKILTVDSADPASGDGWKWDGSCLTLSGVSVARIVLSVDATILLEGVNIVYPGPTADAVSTSADLIVDGSGMLAISAKEGYGIASESDGTITVNNGIITVVSESCGIASNGGAFTVNGGILTVYGDYAVDGFSTYTQNGGYVNLKGGTYGLHTESGTSVSGGYLEAVATLEESIGIECDADTLTNSGGVLKAEGGIRAIDAPDLSFTGGVTIAISPIMALDGNITGLSADGEKLYEDTGTTGDYTATSCDLPSVVIAKAKYDGQVNESDFTTLDGTYIKVTGESYGYYSTTENITVTGGSYIEAADNCAVLLENSGTISGTGTIVGVATGSTAVKIHDRDCPDTIQLIGITGAEDSAGVEYLSAETDSPCNVIGISKIKSGNGTGAKVKASVSGTRIIGTCKSAGGIGVVITDALTGGTVTGYCESGKGISTGGDSDNLIIGDAAASITAIGWTNAFYSDNMPTAKAFGSKSTEEVLEQVTFNLDEKTYKTGEDVCAMVFLCKADAIPAIAVGAQDGAVTYGTAVTGAELFEITATDFSDPAYGGSIEWVTAAHDGITLALNEDGTAALVTTTATAKAGSYKFKVKSGNVVSAEAVLTIEKASKTDNKVYVNDTVGISGVTDKQYDLSSLIEAGGAADSPEVSGSSGLVASAGVNGSTLMFSTTAKPDGTSATILVPVKGCTNYKDYSITLTVTVSGNAPEIIIGSQYGIIRYSATEKSVHGFSVTANNFSDPRFNGVIEWVTEAHNGIVLKLGVNGTSVIVTTTGDADAGDYKFRITSGDVKSNVATLTIAKAKKTDNIINKSLEISSFEETGGTCILPIEKDGVAGEITVGDATFITAASVSGNELNYQVASMISEASSTITIPVTGCVNFEDYKIVVTISTGNSDLHAPSEQPPQPPTGENAPVIVDGETYNIGTSQTSGGVTTVTVDQRALQSQLDTASTAIVVPVIPQNGATAGTAQFVVANVDEMAEKEMTLAVQVDNVSYDMPAVAMNTDTIMKELGAGDASGVPLNITIAKLSEDDAQLEEGELVLPPVEFIVTASFGDRTTEVEVFDFYVQRVIEVGEDDAKRITTAVVVENDKQRHVPTEVFRKEVKWYARINSLTNSVYALIHNDVSFTDTKGKWFEDTVNEMASRCVISGRDTNIFDGEAAITRAEFAAILVRALGLPENGDGSVFTDVDKAAWYYGAVGKAYEYKIIIGNGNGSFYPDAGITRQEAMVMVRRAAAVAEFAGTDGTLESFTDAAGISSWALEAVRWNVGSGLIKGRTATQICASELVTRAEAATIALRLMQRSGLVEVRTQP